jgi:REP element-mobilizing transposase RayT
VEEMHLNEIGNIVRRCWEEIPQHFPCSEFDAFVVMLNHIHGIIVLNDLGRDVQLNVPTRLSPRRGTLSVIIRTYKAAVTMECRKMGYSEFGWQSRFYDHIIRDEKDLDNVRNYIIDNPLKWATDDENPDL